MSMREGSENLSVVASSLNRAPSQPPLSEQLARDEQTTARWFWCFALAHVVIWTLAASLSQPNPTLDMMEMLSWGSHLDWGYYKHPPMPAWIARGSNELFGDVSWPMYLAGQLLTITSIWAAWRMAREVLKPWPALAAAMILEASYYYNFTTTDLNHTITCRPFWSLAVVTMYFALTRHSLGYWLMLGVWLGLGMLSKYYIAVLVVAMLGFAVLHPRTRPLLKTAGPYLTTAVALLIFGPHVRWMFDTDFITIRYIFDRTNESDGWIDHLKHPVQFVVEQLPAVLPMMLLAVPLTGWSWWRRSAKLDQPSQAVDAMTIRQSPLRDDLTTEQLQFAKHYLLAVVVGPIALYVLLSAITGAGIRSMWGAPLLTFAAAMWIAIVGSIASRQACQRVIHSAIIVGCLMLAASVGRNVLSPTILGRASRVHFPGQSLSKIVRDEYRLRVGSEPEIIAGTWWIAGNIAHFDDERREVYGDLDPILSPWGSDEELTTRGGVIVWDDVELKKAHKTKLKRPFPKLAEIQERFPTAIVLDPLKVECQTWGDVPPISIRVVLVPPQNAPVQQLAERESEWSTAPALR